MFSQSEKLFMTAAFLFIKVFSLHHFALFADIEGVDRTVVPHHARPNFALGPVAVFDTVLM